MNMPTLLYAILIYLTMIVFSLFLNVNPTFGKQIPTCQDYLRVCEQSCAYRGKMFRFACLGRGFNPGEERYQCLCADDAFRRSKPAPVAEPVNAKDKRRS